MDTVRISQLTENTYPDSLYTVGSDGSTTYKVPLSIFTSFIKTGYQFMGVASTSTTLTPDEKAGRFWITKTAGTYTCNNVSVTVEEGTVALLVASNEQTGTFKAIALAPTSAALEEAVTKEAEDLYHSIVPSALAVDYPATLTYGNVQSAYITATLTPDGVKQNVIFLSDNEAVKVAPDGRITIKALGTSEVHVIPTCNTALAKTILITVESPALRLTSDGALRLTSAGALRLT